jgi:hypothetical protein
VPTDPNSSCRAAPARLGLSDLCVPARSSRGLVRPLSLLVELAHPFAHVATARRDPSSPQDRPPLDNSRRIGVPCTRWCRPHLGSLRRRSPRQSGASLGRRCWTSGHISRGPLLQACDSSEHNGQPVIASNFLRLEPKVPLRSRRPAKAGLAI